MGNEKNAQAIKKNEGYQYKLSPLLNQKKVGQYANAPFVTDQMFADLIGEDTQKKRINQMKNASTSVFADRYGEMELEGDEFEDRLAEEYKNAYNGTDSITLKSKRAKSAKKKIRAQRHLQKELNLLEEQQKINEKWFQDDINTFTLRRMNERFKTPEEKAAMRDWLVSKRPDAGVDFYELKEGTNGRLGDEDETYGSFLSLGVSAVMDNVELTDYLYSSDERFASLCAIKYQQICQVVSAEVLLNKFVQNRNPSDINISMWRAKIEFAKRMKADYEARMEMMNSPYYAIVAKKDIEKYLGKDGENKLRRDKGKNKLSDGLYNYILLFRKAEELRVASDEVDPEEMFESIKQQCAEESYQSSMECASYVLTKIQDADLKEAEKEYEKAEDKTDDTIGVRYLLKKRTEQVRAGFPEKDEDFMKTILVNAEGKGYFGANTINGIVADDVAKFDEEILEILEGGTVFRNQQIKPEHLPELERLIREYVACRREQFAQSEAYLQTSVIAHHPGHSVDMSNPKFQETDEYKKVKLFLPKEGIPMELFLGLSEYKEKYNNALVKIYEFMNKNRYIISGRHENLTEEKKEKLLAQAKTAFLNRNKKLTDFRKIKINGKEFCLYSVLPAPLRNDIVDQTVVNYTIDKEHEKEAGELFEKLETLCRGEAIRDAQDLQGGDKGLLGMIFNKKFREDMTPELEHLEEIYSHMKLSD